MRALAQVSSAVAAWHIPAKGVPSANVWFGRCVAARRRNGAKHIQMVPQEGGMQGPEIAVDLGALQEKGVRSRAACRPATMRRF